MKVKLIVAIIFSGLVWISCSKDEVEESSNELLGSWRLTNRTTSNGDPGVLNECDLFIVAQYQVNGEVSYRHEGENVPAGCLNDEFVEVKWKSIGDGMFETVFSSDESQASTITINGNTLREQVESENLVNFYTKI